MDIDFMVAGFRKCGTTSMYKVLSQHSRLYIPAVKEIDFFADETEYKKGYCWYLKRYFGDCPEGMVKGEVNPRLSMMDMGVPKKIYENAGKDIKLIFLIRNPAESLYSLFKMRALYGRAFPEEEKEWNLKERQNDAFDYFVRQNFIKKDGKYIASQERTKFRMIDSGRYSSYIKEYLKYFPKEQIKIIVFEEYVKDPKLIYLGLFDYLGVKPEPQIDYYQKAMDGNRMPANIESMQAYSDISEQFAKSVLQYDTADNQRDLKLRLKYEEDIKRTVKIPDVKYKMGPYAREVLTAYYEEEKQEMECLLGQSLKEVWW
ncbi:MAG: sulfotransferase domain-containing protein [Lachnospiraceae bacterium]|nr:sulfotransferase domain-containing protein [Lachnospiraceae bacterium]